MRPTSLMRFNKALSKTSSTLSNQHTPQSLRQYSTFRARFPSALSSKVTAAGVLGIGAGSTFLYTYDRRWVHADSQHTPEEKTGIPGYAPEPTNIENYLPTNESCQQLQKALSHVKSVTELDVTLFQYQVCPFCCKTRAFLDKHKIPYKMVEVHPMGKAELKWSQYKKVPVVIINGVQLNDSSVIITSLSQFLDNLNGENKPVDENEVKWRQWVDDRFVRVIPPNIYRTFEEAKASFEYITDRGEFSYFQQKYGLYAGALAMWGVSKRLSKKYNITDERATLYDCAREWCDAIPKGQPFLGGNEPNLADLAVYGILSSIEGLRAFNDMCENTEIGTFYYRMKENVGESSSEKKSLKDVQSIVDAVKAQTTEKA
eukprot:CAMPEP_0117440810 /NCGR_PEP_ID=MMETSP0759-20121206/3288_1 /TAXON_ID=63605 /ORGANISM="Percolomonas cosmopolitus, Strain WS" /LENGTH=372 /DNA_ID=CAMNT_0005232599 /DNA_START=122 /DNA_END=1240 /DNA_ORIENTATION=+